MITWLEIPATARREWICDRQKPVDGIGPRWVKLNQRIRSDIADRPSADAV